MRARYIVGTAVVGVVALVVGYVVGFRSAWQMGVQAEFAARGVLATQMLQAVRGGKTDFVTTVLEGDVDNALLIGGDFVESPGRRLLPLMRIDAPADYEQFMSRAASYRKANPRDLPSSDPILKGIIGERVQRYAK
jgi:hypothetical protein